MTTTCSIKISATSNIENDSVTLKTLSLSLSLLITHIIPNLITLPLVKISGVSHAAKSPAGGSSAKDSVGENYVTKDARGILPATLRKKPGETRRKKGVGRE